MGELALESISKALGLGSRAKKGTKYVLKKLPTLETWCKAMERARAVGFTGALQSLIPIFSNPPIQIGLEKRPVDERQNA